MHDGSVDSSPGAASAARSKITGGLLLLLALFLALAQASYDWRDMPELNMPAAVPPSNLLGIIGDRWAWAVYGLFGFASWAIPLLPLSMALSLFAGKPPRAARRVFWFLAALVSLSCLCQLLDALPRVAAARMSVNIMFAGGASGYLLMTRGLETLFAPFGAGAIAFASFVCFLMAAVGFRDILSAFAKLVSWAAGGSSAPPDSPGPDAIDAARVASAREEARLAREEERRRKADEKEAERRRREEEREAERVRKLEEKEAERRAREEARAAQKESELMAARMKAEEAAAAARAAEDARRAAAEEAARKAAEEAAARKAAETAGAAPEASGTAAEDGVPAEDGEPAKKPYVLPSIDLLNPVPESCAEHGDIAEMSNRIIDTLRQFGVETTLAFTRPGPVVTQYALTPAPSVKVERISSLSGNLQMSLEAKSLRIEAPIPGKNAVGIEVPNRKSSPVYFRSVAEGPAWQGGKFQVPLLLGKDAAGNDLVADLARLPHLLVAGATGQGKSVCLNSIITGLLLCRTPEQLRFILIDPKRVEFTSYAALPHLLVPVINDTKKVVFGLRWAVQEMEKRLRMFAKAKCRNIVDFNSREISVQQDFFAGDGDSAGEFPRTIPYIVIIIDEVADIMLSAGRDVEPVIARLTALARATGIHLILATQRPDTKTITGTIKSNIPGRIAFKTAQSVDSRTILDSQGAEDLIGKGDMLYRTPEGLLIRAQGAFLADEEISRVVGFIGEHAGVDFDKNFSERLAKIKEADPEDELEDGGEDDDSRGGGKRRRRDGDGFDDDGADEEPQAPAEPPQPQQSINDMEAPSHITTVKELELYNQAIEILRRTKRASTSYLQRRMGIGYTHAARLVDILEETGVVGPSRGSGSREILVDLENFVPLTAADLPALSAADGRPIDPAAFVAAHGAKPLNGDGGQPQDG